MVTTAPLSYEGLKVVIQHLDANKRFEISKRCPSIRKTERVVPLKIIKLQLKNHAIMVNATKYNITTFRKYREKRLVPPHHDDSNRDPSYCEELDQYGAVQKFQTVDLTPGDILVRQQFNNERTDEEDIARLSEIIEDIADYLGSSHAMSKFMTVRRLPQCDHNVDDLDRFRDELKSFLNRKNNVLPKFEVMIKLEMTNRKDRSVQIQLKKKTMKIHEALKALTTFMFGERRSSILVKNLVMDHTLQVIRLPIGLKFKVRELLSDPLVLSVIGPIIDETSLPLEAFRFGKRVFHVGEISHPWEKTARKLIFPSDKWSSPLPEVISNLPHREILLEGDEMTMDRFRPVFNCLIKRWTENSKEIGSYVWFEQIEANPTRVMEKLETLSGPFNGNKIDERTIIIPLNKTSQFKVVLEVEETSKAESNNFMESDDSEDDFEAMSEAEHEQEFDGFIKIVVVPV